jgi:glutaredoxin-related protein
MMINPLKIFLLLIAGSFIQCDKYVEWRKIKTWNERTKEFEKNAIEYTAVDSMPSIGKKQLPKFLAAYPKRDKYFVRLKPWDWLSEKEIYIPMKVNNKPSMVTYDFWSQEIYLDATGQITVTELVEIATNQYKDSEMDIPENLDKILINILESLVNDVKVIEFRDSKTALDKKVDKPISKQ